MPVYLILDITIIDQDVYEEYVERVPAVVEQYGSLPEIRNGLFDRALYQIVRAGIETTNMTLAASANSA